MSSQKTLMLVAYPLPGKGYRYPIRRGSGLFISSTAFGDAPNQIFSRIVPRFSFYKHLNKVDAEGDEQLAVYSMGFFGTLYIGVILLYIILGVIFGVVVSLIFRPYILWYFKINRRIYLQEETNRLLDELKSKKHTNPSISGQRNLYPSDLPK